VSEIYREFERHLAGWRVRYTGRPDREMLRLCLADRRDKRPSFRKARTLPARVIGAPSTPDAPPDAPYTGGAAAALRYQPRPERAQR